MKTTVGLLTISKQEWVIQNTDIICLGLSKRKLMPTKAFNNMKTK